MVRIQSQIDAEVPAVHAETSFEVRVEVHAHNAVPAAITIPEKSITIPVTQKSVEEPAHDAVPAAISITIPDKSVEIPAAITIPETQTSVEEPAHDAVQSTDILMEDTPGKKVTCKIEKN